MESARMCTGKIFLSTPSARRANLRHSGAVRWASYFYPRPPRGGRPRLAPHCNYPSRYFYPRPPRGGRRGRFVAPSKAYVFLSTPSARRATPGHRPLLCHWVISIHALREEGDFWWADVPRICIEFLSTPSARRATHQVSGKVPSVGHFYPRPPRGGRPR